MLSHLKMSYNSHDPSDCPNGLRNPDLHISIHHIDLYANDRDAIDITY